MLEQAFDCVAVPLPESFRHDVENSIVLLPTPTIVCQRETPRYDLEWDAESEQDPEDEDPPSRLSYVPIDPCQPVIAALRVGMGEHIPRAFIDLETDVFQPRTDVFPDPYALKHVPVERFAAALLPTIDRPPDGQAMDRIVHMAGRLRELESRFQSVLFVCSVLDWPWIRDAFREKTPSSAEHDLVEETQAFKVHPSTLIFMLGELPFITGLYEKARNELEMDDNLSIDGIKELLVTARDAYRDDFLGRARKVTPQTLSICLQYIRNLTLVNGRMTPDLYNIVIAAKQSVGDGFAIHVAETARKYAYSDPTPLETIKVGIDRLRFPDGEIAQTVCRLPGPPIQWRSCELRRRPDRQEQKKWAMKWNPFGQCSWPPEDELIETFRARVTDRAKAIMGADLARTEKFTTSIRDGIDIRDTLRNWYSGDLYVKVLPPHRGSLDAAVMLFDSPADPRDYPWRSTWFAEHQNESTLAFFASDFREQLVGPGIALATYGGALFLFPPVSIHDVWTDPYLDFAETMEERLLGAACLHSRCPHIALLSHYPPGAGWRRLAKRFKKKWIHVPLASFGQAKIEQLRMVHVLNGRQVRSYASHFIRKA